MSAKEASLWFSLSPSVETMPMQHDVLPGPDKKRKSEKICMTVQYCPPESGQKPKTAENQWFRRLENQCATKSADLLHMSPEKTFV